LIGELRTDAERDDKDLDLFEADIHQDACYGHFGRTEPEFSWESTDKAPVLIKAAGKKI